MAPRCTSEARVDGKTVIITGGNAGIGRETAKDLLKRGAKVIIACRDVEKGRKAAEEMCVETSTSADKSVVMKLDLNSMESIHNFTKEFLEKENRLDILINNAGVMNTDYGKTQDGFELQFGINHLGHFLLTLLLLDRLKQSAPSRIITLSSVAHEHGTIYWDDIMAEKRKYKKFYAYAQSKLANYLFTRELGKRLEGTGVTTYAVHPGIIDSGLWETTPLLNTWLGKKVRGWYMLSVEEGAQTTLYCAVDESLADKTGCYYTACAEKEAARHARSDEDAKRLWDISLQYVKLMHDPTQITNKNNDSEYSPVTVQANSNTQTTAEVGETAEKTQL